MVHVRRRVRWQQRFHDAPPSLPSRPRIATRHLPFVFLTSLVIPAMFGLRDYWIRSHNAHVQLSLGDNRALHLQFLRQNSATELEFESEFVELLHCNMTHVDWIVFLDKVEPVLDSFLGDFIQKSKLDVGTVWNMRQEFLLELAEQYLSFEGRCDYSNYRPTVPRNKDIKRVESVLQQQYTHMYIISAYHDVDQLNDLIDALYNEKRHHLILVHVEAGTSGEFRNAIDPRATVVSFGRVVYKTDSLSMINLRLLQWLTIDLAIQYDYVFLLNGETYPLVSSEQLLLLNEAVYLGELNHKGKPVYEPSDMLLLHKRLIHSQTKLHRRLKTLFWQPYKIRESIKKHMLYKSVSGNQGVYRRDVIVELLDNDLVMELFSHAKFGCCNVLEERTWIAALDILGYRDTAMKNPSMFQVWGGAERCKGSMSNVVLSVNDSLCYRNEHPGYDVYFWGNETLEHLKSAKDRGFLFARKFQSNDRNSTELKEIVRNTLWI